MIVFIAVQVNVRPLLSINASEKSTFTDTEKKKLQHGSNLNKTKALNILTHFEIYI